jgi:hypothetical protein
MDIVKTGSTWILRTAPILDATGARLTGLTDIKFSVSRYTSGAWQWLDTADSTFRASPAGYQFTMTEVSSTKAAGVYAYALDTSTITNVTFGDQLFIDIQQTTLTNAINANQEGGGVYGEVVDKVEANLTVATSTLATSSALATVQADTDDIQTRLPAALVGGRMDASVGAMAANVLTASAIASDAITSAKIATDAIGSAQLASDAVTEIQTGLATSSALSTAQAAITDIQTRLPAALVAGRIDASVGAMAADTLTSSALASSAVTEIQAGLATAANVTDAVAAIDAHTDSAVAPLATAATLTAIQGAGWSASDNLHTIAGYGAPPSAGAVSAAVVDQALSGHTTAGTVGEALSRVDVAVSTRLATSGYTAPPSAATISTQVNTDLTTAHGAGSYQTASTAGLATATDVSNGTAAVEAYGDLHWTTAVGFAIPGSAMNLADDAITAAKIAAGAIGASEAPLLAHLDADVSSRLATSGYTAPPSAAANAAAVWATVESTGVDGTMGGSLWKTRRRLTQRASTSVLGVVTLYLDDNVTPETTFTLTDVDGNPVTIVAGDPARRSAET